METFVRNHREDVLGVLTTFDRIIFKGHLTGFFPLDFIHLVDKSAAIG